MFSCSDLLRLVMILSFAGQVAIWCDEQSYAGNRGYAGNRVL